MIMDAALARLLARPIAHRGLHGGGGAGPIENSLGAAAAAVASGFGIECDVQLSRDGEVVVFHDEDLGRLTGATGRLADLDAAAIARLTLRGSGEHVPTLADLLRRIDGKVPLVIEMKSLGDPRLVDRTLALAEAYAGPTALESFDPAVVLRCRVRGTRCPVGLVGPGEAGDPPHSAAVAASDFLSWDIQHLAGIAARPGVPALSTWTVRTKAQQALAIRHGAQIVFEGFDPDTVP